MTDLEFVGQVVHFTTILIELAGVRPDEANALLQLLPVLKVTRATISILASYETLDFLHNLVQGHGCLNRRVVLLETTIWKVYKRLIDWETPAEL